MKLLLPALAALLIAAPAAGAAEPLPLPPTDDDLTSKLVPVRAKDGTVVLRFADPALRRLLGGRRVDLDCTLPARRDEGLAGLVNEYRVPRGARSLRTGHRAGTLSRCTVILRRSGGAASLTLGIVGLDATGREVADQRRVFFAAMRLFGALSPSAQSGETGFTAEQLARLTPVEVLAAPDAEPTGAVAAVFRQGDHVVVKLRRRDGRVDFIEAIGDVVRTNMREALVATP